MNLARTALVISTLLVSPVAALAYGGHDAVGCPGCHSAHKAKSDVIFTVPANKVTLDPRTGKPYAGMTPLCLGCHADSDKGGQGFAPVSAHTSHPLGTPSVNTKIAKVPPELLRAGQFDCLGCHDPHPSNPYYKYLRVDTGSAGANMDKFCAVCHAMKADVALASEKPALFTSMDEGGNRVLAAPSAKDGAKKAPATAPAKAKKQP